MLDILFKIGGDLVDIRLIDKSLYFSKVSGNRLLFSDISGLKFDINGIKKEFPDLAILEDSEEIKKIAIERFKQKINGMSSEKEIVLYLKEDLAKHGYILVNISRPGFRPTKEIK
jgi:hypothetical protein